MVFDLELESHIAAAPQRKPRGVIFDWDNTIINSWPRTILAINNTLEAMGYEAWTDDEVKARAQRSLRDSFPLLFGDDWEKAQKIFLDHFTDDDVEYIEYMPGAFELLQTLHDHNIPMSIVSNKTGTALRHEVHGLQIPHFFKIVIGAQDSGADKPSPEPAMAALEAMSLSPSPDIWFMGDALVDLECAAATGVQPVLVGESVKAIFDYYNMLLKSKPKPFHFLNCWDAKKFLDAA